MEKRWKVALWDVVMQVNFFDDWELTKFAQYYVKPKFWVTCHVGTPGKPTENKWGPLAPIHFQLEFEWILEWDPITQWFIYQQWWQIMPKFWLIPQTSASWLCVNGSYWSGNLWEEEFWPEQKDQKWGPFTGTKSADLRLWGSTLIQTLRRLDILVYIQSLY